MTGHFNWKDLKCLLLFSLKHGGTPYARLNLILWDKNSDALGRQQSKWGKNEASKHAMCKKKVKGERNKVGWSEWQMVSFPNAPENGQQYHSFTK